MKTKTCELCPIHIPDRDRWCARHTRANINVKIGEDREERTIRETSRIEEEERIGNIPVQPKRKISFREVVFNYLADAYEPMCQSCGEELSFETSSIDHIIPVSNGGQNRMGNLQLLCQPCNARKGGFDKRRSRKHPAHKGGRPKVARIMGFPAYSISP